MKEAKFIYTFAVFSELNNGKRIEKKVLEDKISSLSIFNILESIFRMSIPSKENLQLTKEFLKAIDPQFSEKLTKHKLYSDQGILALWKWCLSSGKEFEYDLNKHPAESAMETIKLCMGISDYLDGDVIKVDYYMFSNALFNNKNSTGSDLARAYIIFVDIAQTKTLFKEKEFLDIGLTFQDHYGYSLEEYIAIMFEILSSLNDKRTSYANISKWFIKESEFCNTRLYEEFQNIIQELSLPLNQAQSWSTNNRDDIWNFTQLRQKPFLTLDHSTYYPVHITLLQEKLFSELYFKIRESFPKEDSQILSFYGRCFERYVENISEKSIDTNIIKNKVPYDFIAEFEYRHNSKTKRSPDVLIRLNNKILLVEAKAYRVRMDSYFADDTTIEKDLQKIAIDPINQIYERLLELIEISHLSIQSVDEFYLMSVTLGHFPTLIPFEDKISNALSSLPTTIKGHFHLDIEEYEMLMELISRKSASPVFKYLDNKKRLFSHLSFKNYLIDSYLYPKTSEFLESNLEETVNKLRKIIF